MTRPRSRLEAALRENDLTIIDRIDHSRNASQAGLGLLPTLLIVFGNPAAGTPLMQAERTVAIDLPQKMLVYQDNDGVFVAYNDPMYLAERHHLTGVDAHFGERRGHAPERCHRRHRALSHKVTPKNRHAF